MRTAMHSLKSLLTILFIFALSPATQAGDYRLYDRGIDGFEYYYEVSCVDPYVRGTIVVKYEEQEGDSPEVVEICLSGGSGKERCKANWTVTKAAQSFCK